MALDLTTGPRRIAASTRNGAIDITVPHGVYALTTTANDENTVTGVTNSRHATHSIRATAPSGDVTISGR